MGPEWPHLLGLQKPRHAFKPQTVFASMIGNFVCTSIHTHSPHPNPRLVLEFPWSLLSLNIHSQGSEHVPCTRHFARCWDAVGSKTKPGSCPPGAHILAVATGTNQSSSAHTHHHGGGTLGVLRVLPAPASHPTSVTNHLALSHVCCGIR